MNARQIIKSIIAAVVTAVVYLATAFYLPYFIQFDLHFLGANMVTLEDVIGLWLSCQLIGIFVSLGILIAWNNER